MASRDIQNRSRRAVAVAGMKAKRGLSGSAHHWTPLAGKREDGPWRPGKTKNSRKRSA
jgi:hypothetical protein